MEVKSKVENHIAGLADIADLPANILLNLLCIHAGPAAFSQAFDLPLCRIQGCGKLFGRLGIDINGDLKLFQWDFFRKQHVFGYLYRKSKKTDIHLYRTCDGTDQKFRFSHNGNIPSS